MQLWDAMCGTILSQGARRGAIMSCLRCDHPDIERFIDAKREAGRLHCFNLSVLVTQDFLKAVEGDQEWPLVFPVTALDDAGGPRLHRAWSGSSEAVPCRVFRHMRARDLWERIMRSAWETAEPGVLFIDRINHWDNLGWRERISATNPCGEVPLPPMALAILVPSI